MKKIYYIIFVGMFFMLSGVMKAQSTKQDQVLIAYPNPTKSSLFLETKKKGVKIQSVTFFSLLGRPVATYKINATSTKINLGILGRGKYLMKYTLDNKKSRVQQIIKQ